MDKKQSILIVDDDESTCRMLTLLFGNKGYETEAVGTGREAIEKAQERFFNVALLDIRLPDMEGTELLAPLKAMHPDMVVIMITGYASLETAVRAVNVGASAYIPKPLNIDEMLARVRDTLEKQHLVMENRRLYKEAQRELAERKRAEQELQQSFRKLQRTLEETVHALASAVEMRDPYTAGHQRQVSQLACAIAKGIGLSEQQIEGIRVAGLIHDIGKISTPAEILSKPSELSRAEINLIKNHPQVSYEILRKIEFPWPIAQIVLQHHERMNGSGYPKRLVGEDILPEARILAVSDVVEAMSSHRPYRPALGIDKALEEISQNRGVLYDPEVVDVCLKLFAEKGFKLVYEGQGEPTAAGYGWRQRPGSAQHFTLQLL